MDRVVDGILQDDMRGAVNLSEMESYNTQNPETRQQARASPSQLTLAGNITLMPGLPGSTTDTHSWTITDTTPWQRYNYRYKI